MSHCASSMMRKNCQNLQQKLDPKKMHITLLSQVDTDLFHGCSQHRHWKNALVKKGQKEKKESYLKLK